MTLTHIMYETFNFGLHSPVSELHFAELIGAHDRALGWILVDLFDPVFRQWPSFGLHRLIQLRVFLNQVLVRGNVVLYYVYGVYEMIIGMTQR